MSLNVGVQAGLFWFFFLSLDVHVKACEGCAANCQAAFWNIDDEAFIEGTSAM